MTLRPTPRRKKPVTAGNILGQTLLGVSPHAITGKGIAGTQIRRAALQLAHRNAAIVKAKKAKKPLKTR